MRILWIPHTGWHIPQRAHLFCRALSEKHEVHVTDLVADFSQLRDYFSIRYLRNLFHRQYMDGKITVHGVPRISPALFSPPLRKWNRHLFSTLVNQIINTYSIEAVVGTFVVPPPQAPRLIFDLFDDNVSYWRSYGANRSYADEIAEIEEAYLSRSHVVLAASSVLIDIARQRGCDRPIEHMPNGVDVSHYRVNTQKHDPITVGLIGNHDKFSELEKTLQAAQELPNIRFRIAGRGHALPQAKTLAQDLDLQNVTFDGAVSMIDAPDWLELIDIGLCPYNHTRGADAGSPMRLLQYSAAGLPVVCTELEEVKRMNFPNVVLVQDNARSLINGILGALSMPKMRHRQIMSYDIERLIGNLERILNIASPSLPNK